MEPGGRLPASACCKGVSRSTRWKVSFAVWPSRRLMLSGSFSPGTWTRMRSSPWRWIVGSRVPTSSIRRRTISSDCRTAESWSSRTALSVSRASIRPPSPSTTSSSRASGLGLRSSSSATASPASAGSVKVRVTASPRTPRPR